MDEQSDYIKAFEEEFEPDSHSFVTQYVDYFKSNFSENDIPKDIKFLFEENFRVSAPTTNKTYLSVCFSKPGYESYVGKFSLTEDGVDLSKEYKILRQLESASVAPRPIYFKDAESETDISFLLTTMEGSLNNLNSSNPQFWWEENKESFVQQLQHVHSIKNALGISNHEDILINDFISNVLFDEENLFDFIFREDVDTSTFDFITKCEEICLEICSKLDKNDFVLLHNNLCKSSVLFEPNSDEKFKFINFHKAIIGPPAIDLLSSYHRLSLEKEDIQRFFNLNNFHELKSLYEKLSSKEIDYSVDIRFLNTVQRIMFLLYENNFQPVVLFQSNPIRKFKSRSSELNHLKSRFLNIIRDNDFSFKNRFKEYNGFEDLPFKELLLYG